MRTIGERAVVLGAGIGGLLAARALADAYEHVTVIDRDALPAGVAPRRAVPQGQHVHALLPSGQACMEQLLPGLTGELLADGAVPYRALTELRFMVGGHWLARGDVGRDSLVASRPFIEGHVRRRVRALENVTILDRCDAAGLTTDAGGERVTGVRVLRREPGSAAETLPADLVVAATGRSARLARGWKSSATRDRTRSAWTSTSATPALPLRLPDGALGADKLVLIGARPDLPRSLGLFAQEHGRWLLTVGGYAGHHPPRELDGLMRFAASVAPLDVTTVLRAAEPVRRDRLVPVPGQPPALLRAHAAPAGRAGAARRRDLRIQPDLRPGHVGRGRPGGRAATVDRRRARAARAPLPERRGQDRRPRLAADRGRRPRAARRGRAAVRANPARQRLRAPPARKRCP